MYTQREQQGSYMAMEVPINKIKFDKNSPPLESSYEDQKKKKSIEKINIKSASIRQLSLALSFSFYLCLIVFVFFPPFAGVVTWKF